MMLMKGDAKRGGTAVLLVLEPVDLHEMLEHGEMIPVPLEDLGIEGVEMQVVTSSKEELEEALERYGMPYEKIERKHPDGK